MSFPRKRKNEEEHKGYKKKKKETTILGKRKQQEEEKGNKRKRILSTFVGTPGIRGFRNEKENVLLDTPEVITSDSFGNIYFFDKWNKCIRKATCDREVSTFCKGSFLFCEE